jgi:tetratricopeptide (TPR) repeat protein
VQLPSDSTESRQNLLDRAYSDYCRHQAEGDPIDPRQFCAAYPSIRSSLARLLSVHHRVNEDPFFLNRPELRWPEAGEHFLGFDLERELGRGAFAHVFLAREPALGNRQVVVKLSQHGASEALTLGRLAHPNIVPVHSVRSDERTGLSSVCMPYLGQATLCHVLDQVLLRPAVPQRAAVILDAARSATTEEMPASAAARRTESFLREATYVQAIRQLAEQLLDALALIHARGVLHRDLKPSNVLLTPAGVPMLLDFNLSQDNRRDEIHFGGTPVYMAPEQLQLMENKEGGAAGLDARCDLFSLGVILYELLTGRHPFSPPPIGTPLEVTCRRMLAQQVAGAGPIRGLNPAVDPPLADFIHRCLAFAPEQRPASATQAQALLTPPISRVVRARRAIATSPGAVLTGLVVATLVGTPFLWSSFRPPETLPAVSERDLAEAARGEHDLRKQVDHLARHLLANPDDVQAWLSRGKAHQELSLSEADPAKKQDYALRAVADFDRADSLQRDASTKAYLGYAYHVKGDLNSAWANYRKALDSGFDSPALTNNLACIELQQGRLALAESHLDSAINRDPQFQAAFHNRAWVHMHHVFQAAQAQQALQTGKGRPTKGAKAAQQAVEERYSKAIDDLATALKVGPASRELFFDAGKINAQLFARGKQPASQAIGFLDRAIALGLTRSAIEREALLAPLQDPACKSALDDLCRRAPSSSPTEASRRIVPILPD